MKPMTIKKPTKKTKTLNDLSVQALLWQVLVVLCTQVWSSIKWFYRGDNLAIALEQGYRNLYRVLAVAFVAGQMCRAYIDKTKDELSPVYSRILRKNVRLTETTAVGS